MSAWTIEDEKRYAEALEKIISDPPTEGGAAVAMMMADFRPAENAPDDSMDSATVANALENCVCVSVNEVAQVMRQLGCRLRYVSLDVIVWGMRYVAGENPCE